MKLKKLLISAIFSTTATTLLLTSQTVSATNLVYLNSDEIEIQGVIGTVAGAKYRLSAANFDQSLDNGAGTNGSGNFIALNLGRNTQLSGTDFDFELKYLTGQGYIFTMTNKNANINGILSWGTFTSPVAGTTRTLLNGVAPTAPFNAIKLEARAGRIGSSMSFKNFSFSSPTLSIADGAFWDDTVNPTTQGDFDANLGFYSQWLVGDELSQHDWIIRGTVNGVRDNTAGGDEFVRFLVDPKLISYVHKQKIPEPGVTQGVPEPSSVLSLLAIGMFGSGYLFKKLHS